MCVCGDAFVGCFLPSRRRKCQAGNFAMFTHRREHGERREVVVRRFPRPRFTQISFNPEKRELRQHFLPACFPYLICGNLRNRADGISEIEGKGAMGSAEQGGSGASFNLRISQSPRPSCALW